MEIYRLLFCVGFVRGLSVTLLPETIPRTNWGVVFRKSDVILNGMGKFRHTFLIKVPTLNYQPIQLMPCDHLNLRDLHCEAINEMITSINQQNQPIIQEYKSRIETWMRGIPDVDDNIFPGRPRRQRRSITLDKAFCDTLNAGGKVDGESDGFLASIGKFFTSLSGQPTWDDIKVFYKTICKSLKVVELQKEEISNLNNALGSFQLASNNRMDAIESAMKDTQAEVSETKHALLLLANYTEVAISELNMRLQISVKGTNLLFRMLKQLYNFQAKMYSLSEEVERFGDGINSLLSGRLPSAFVNIDQMQAVINSVKLRLADTNILKLSETNPAFYYMTDNVVFTKCSRIGVLFIMINIPVYSTTGLMAAYRIEKTFLGTKEGGNSSTMIANLPDFIAVSTDNVNQYYSELSSSDMTSCKGDKVKICPVERSLQSFSDYTCAIALYKDNGKEIWDKCDFRIEEKPQSSGAIKLIDNVFLMHSAFPGERIWQLSCPLKPSASKNIPSCTACFIEVPCGCTFSAPGEFILSLQLDGCSNLMDEQDVVEVQPRYPFNLAVLQATNLMNFSFDVDSTTTSRIKFNLNLPDLTAISYQWDQSVERSQQYSSDLKKLASDVLARRDVFATKADAMLKEASDFTEINLGPLKHMKKIFSGKWSGLLSNENKSGSFFITCSFILPSIAIMMGLYILCKARRV